MAGLRRGLQVMATGEPITMPVGEAVLGRLLGVMGDVRDDGPPSPADIARWPIHRSPPLSEQMGGSSSFAIGIKVIDLLVPLARRGKAAMFGGAGVGKTVLSEVGIYDTLREEDFPNGAFNVTEFGTVKDTGQFRALYAYSP